MKHFSVPMLATTLLLAASLTACETQPVAPSAAVAAKPEVAFVDLQGFDRDLSGALAAKLPKVDVAFYDRIAPSALPERLHHWMASVEAGGGTVKVTPPPGSVTPKDPFLLISAISAVWNASKMVNAAAINAQYKPAQAYDAQIVLKADPQGVSVVDKIVFVQRPSK
ncbi:hypothetical protein [Rhodoferax aquaticus]|uniref:Uncharacterized protein n=1 Tax=Rhodoferax aquaticus TaxID=2527691 RepID=A0A515EJA9_9BURK|nr:hypothetical protein [Rhodoferax aquaticus]QDL52758.1 hypothetical protein EXZ61_00410 [Rhodoferax aquaticus]